MALRETLTDAQMKTMNLVHRGLLAVSGGRIGQTLGSMPVVRLRHTGRTSGRSYETMLTTPIQEDDRYVLVASKGGDDRDPEWYRNLVAHPDAELVVDGETVPITARTATAEEKAELWPRIVEAYRGYAGYQKRTDREIPVVICDRRTA
jgi:deazaflavin-dependent oxidoreductase (nitroreductase family)